MFFQWTWWYHSSILRGMLSQRLLDGCWNYSFFVVSWNDVILVKNKNRLQFDLIFTFLFIDLICRNICENLPEIRKNFTWSTARHTFSLNGKDTGHVVTWSTNQISQTADSRAVKWYNWWKIMGCVKVRIKCKKLIVAFSACTLCEFFAHECKWETKQTNTALIFTAL